MATRSPELSAPSADDRGSPLRCRGAILGPWMSRWGRSIVASCALAAVRARRRARGRARRADRARLAAGDARARALRLRCLAARSGPTCAPAPTSSATRRSPCAGSSSSTPSRASASAPRSPTSQRMDGVLYAEPDRVVHQTATPNDPLLSYEWGLTRHPRARGLGRHHRLGAGDRRAWSTPGSTPPTPTSPQPVDEPRRVGRRARDQRPRRRRQRAHRRRARLGLRRPATRSPRTATATARTSRARSPRAATTPPAWPA